MIKSPPTKQEKKEAERPLDEMSFETGLEWKFMKTLKSETGVRQWHIKVHLGETKESGRDLFEDFCIAQMWQARHGERLYAYRASRSGRPIDLLDYLFVKPGEDYLHGIEYLLRFLEGQDISDLRLDN